MDYMISTIMRHIKTIDYDGPAMFVIIFLTLLAVFRKWTILLVTLLVIVLGWGAQDLIIMNMRTNSAMVSIPLLIYSTGGVVILLLILFSFYKS